MSACVRVGFGESANDGVAEVHQRLDLPHSHEVSASDGELDHLGTVDLGTVDLGTVDLGTVDLGTVDLGTVDLGTVDGSRDQSAHDTVAVDSAPEACIPHCTNQPCGADDGCGSACQAGCITDMVHGWSARFGNALADKYCQVAIDPSGNIIITGTFQGTIDFGGAPLISAGETDIFVVSYDSSGVYRWSKRLGSPLRELTPYVVADANGHVTVAGSFQGTVDFGGGALTSAGSYDVFVASYDSNGVHRWSKQLGASPAEGVHQIMIDSADSVIILGYFSSSIDLGGSLLSTAGNDDIFIASYDSNGVHRWSKSIGGPLWDHSWGGVVDANDNVLVTGGFQGAVDFGGGSLTSAGGYDIFLASYTSTGVHRWSKGFGSVSHDLGNALAAHGGNITFTGSFGGTITLGGASLTAQGSSDAFLASYDSDGIHRWSMNFGVSSYANGAGVAVDANGNAIVTGSFRGTLNPGAGLLTSAGTDVFVASYDSYGTHLWSDRYGSSLEDAGLSIAVDRAGNFTLTGYFEGGVDFGGGLLTSLGDADIFVLQLWPR
ncbi:MAG: hypothetical protein JRH20_30015 [Deltaproteobacteria bacterium]|nr:hypothetical protein [Deltaproteobacteria bacterium]